MIQLNRLHHLAIIASNYEVSKDFYCRVLGFTIQNETYRADRQSHKCDLALKGIYFLELFTFPHAPARVSQPEALGLRHVCFEVTDLTQTCLELKLQGVESEPIRLDPLSGKRYTFISDPDHLPIELFEA